MCTTKKYVICGLTSVVFCLGFIILAVYLPGVINSFLVNQVLIQQRWILSNSSQGFSQWQSNFYGGAPPANLYVYAYNVTNPTDVINGAKPVLDQLGPYVYNWDWYLFDVEWSSDDKFVNFFKAEYYVFNRDLTDKALDPIKDHCFFPSLAYAGLRANLGAPGDDHWWQALLVDIIQSAANVNQTIKEQSGPFIYTSVNEFVWGFDSQLLLWINQTFGSLIPNTTINPVVAVQNNDTSQAAVRNRLKQRDQFQTGKDDTTKLNQYSKFRGSSNLTIWGNDDANMVRGTDGLGFQVDLQGFQPIEVMVDNIYRHVRFVSNQTYSVQGIDTNLYFIDVNEFSNDLKQYYLDAPSGVSNITAVNVVTQGSPIPIIVSQPHYFSADPYYADQIEILPPNDVTDLMKHNTFLFVEPHTGLTLKANKRLQVNLQIKPSLLTYPNIKPAFVPVVWFEESSELSADQAAFWQNNVGQAIKWMKNIPVIALCLAGIFLFVSGAVLFQAYLISRPPPHYSPINQ